jgi:hypothetical protein
LVGVSYDFVFLIRRRPALDFHDCSIRIHVHKSQCCVDLLGGVKQSMLPS